MIKSAIQLDLHESDLDTPIGPFVDVHCHVLPGIDDGPATLEQAVEMLRLAAAQGTTEIVASPHANYRYRFEPELLAARIEQVQEASGGIVRIHAGCELHLNAENISEVLQRPSRYSINGRQYLLVELPEVFVAPVVDDVLRRFREVGLIPIVVHPERNGFITAARVEKWVDNGCLVQVTAGSCLNRFGPDAQRSAADLLAAGLVHLIASDGHNTSSRPPVLRNAYRRIQEQCGEPTAAALFMANPAAVIAGAPVVSRVRSSGPGQSVWRRLLGPLHGSRSAEFTDV